MTPELESTFERWMDVGPDIPARLSGIEGYQRPVMEVLTQINAWRSAHRGALRADAAYFLLVNAQEMIVAPLAVGALVPPDTLSEQLGRDLDQILQVAKGRGEVTAHQMLEIVAGTWEDLSLTRSRWWD